ncbi:MAG TPA: efflux RND transporter periplasmic adaptor subunit [Geopsychrobacteraceae bacterium]|jgi:membrane fusion protein (multidrug efflux system)
MKRPILLTILGLLVLAGLLAGIKALQIRAMIDQGRQFSPPAEVVTSVAVTADRWETLLTAVGTLEAVQGVVVTAEMTGKVEHIAFASGADVSAGELLVQQDISVEKAQLQAAEALAELARGNFERAAKLLPGNAVSRADYDTNRAQLAEARARVDNLRAVIARKTIRAPFAGRLGIRRIDPGQIISDGDAIVTLQSLDPIYVNFLLPQQHLARVRAGLEVRVLADARPDQPSTGLITAIDPQLDAATRNVRVQALLDNLDEQLRAGMYVDVSVVLPQRQEVLTIPLTAVLNAPYSASVFLIEEQKNADGSSAGKVVRQQFVTLGERRGDLVVVLSGLAADDLVVSTGVFKLRNGQAVEVDNTLAPDFKLAPRPAEG